jgi:hypothetical protein
VRGAETVGYLTRDGEGTIAPVDCLVLTPEGVDATQLPGGPDPLWRATPAAPTRQRQDGGTPLAVLPALP